MAEVLGQDSIISIIKNAARLDRLAHAYLFYGPKGCGKTSLARLVAKLGNCEKRNSDEKFKALGEPCNECSACREIEAGRSMDVIEIDAASNRGIDEIRDLKENIRVAPSSLKHKVYIIDECHQLTKEAFNALLKTLEEPPKHAIIILVTTELEKMPMTIVSRTQRFHFKKVSVPIIAEKLKEIADAEKIKISKDAAELVAAAAEGSFRDAESILDQISNFDKDIEIDDVEKILGRAGFRKTADFADLIIGGNLSGALGYLSEMNEGGYNPVQFNKDLIHYFRRLLALRFSDDLEGYFRREMTEDDFKKVLKQSKSIDPEKTIELIKSLIEAYTEMRYSPFAIVPLEVAIIENLK